VAGGILAVSLEECGGD